MNSCRKSTRRSPPTLSLANLMYLAGNFVEKLISCAWDEVCFFLFDTCWCSHSGAFGARHESSRLSAANYYVTAKIFWFIADYAAKSGCDLVSWRSAIPGLAICPKSTSASSARPTQRSCKKWNYMWFATFCHHISDIMVLWCLVNMVIPIKLWVAGTWWERG